MTDKDILDIFKKTGGLKDGHFILTSGYHSPNYFQCALVLQYPEYNTLFSYEIAENFKNDNVDVVISPAIGGIVFGTEVGRILNKRTIFAERNEGKMTLRRGFSIGKGEKVLICEDVTTTGGSVFELMDIVRECGAETVGVGCIIDRSDGAIDFGVKQVSLAKLKVEKYKEDEIPDWLKEIPTSKPGSRK